MQAIYTHQLSNKVTSFFSLFNANYIAKKVGASKRKERKASSTDIIVSYWKALSVGTFSYDIWAQQISNTIGKTYSKQAIWKRIGPEFITLLKILIEKSFKQKLDKFIDNKLFNHFKNVYIQDATHFKLPRFMSDFYPGSYSRYGKSSTLKIQATLNITKGLYSNFDLSSFRDNDQKESPNILKSLKQNDLIIRDLGYFVLDVFNKIDKNGAYFLSRLRYGVTLYEKDNTKNIDILKLLEKQMGKALDIELCLGKNKILKCRVIAIPVPENIKNERIRKAKKDRSKSANHSKEYYKRLGYTMYITNVPNTIWSVNDVNNAYKSRWYIETLFKGWKSSLKMNTTIPKRYANKISVDFYIYANMLMINILVLPIFIHINNIESEKSNKFISIIKIFSYIFNNIRIILKVNSVMHFIEDMRYYCTYESRIKRNNALELIML